MFFSPEMIDYNSNQFKKQLINFIQEKLNILPFSNVYYILKDFCSQVQTEYYKYLNKMPPYAPNIQQNQQNTQQNQQNSQQNQQEDNEN